MRLSQVAGKQKDDWMWHNMSMMVSASGIIQPVAYTGFAGGGCSDWAKYYAHGHNVGGRVSAYVNPTDCRMYNPRTGRVCCGSSLHLDFAIDLHN